MENLFNKLVEENESHEENFVTPQSIAWKLLTDDYHEDLSGALLAFSPDYTQEEDPASFLFEMLLTICLELVSQMALIMHTTEELDNSDSNVVLTKKDFQFEVFFARIKKIFSGVSILFSVGTYDSNSNYTMVEQILKNRYCRVIFRYNHENAIHFDKNDVPDDVNYHFILNENYKNTNDLRNIYAVIVNKNIIYKLSFDKIAKIASTKCV